jgi:RNase P subunit RPR2
MATALKTFIEGKAFHCTRCSGLMVPIWLNDVGHDQGSNAIIAWRCIACGEVIDPVIIGHRRDQPTRHLKDEPKRRPAQVLSRKSRLVNVG